MREDGKDNRRGPGCRCASQVHGLHERRVSARDRCRANRALGKRASEQDQAGSADGVHMALGAERLDGNPAHQRERRIRQQTVVELDICQGVAPKRQHAQAIAIGKVALAGPACADGAHGDASQSRDENDERDYVNHSSKQVRISRPRTSRGNRFGQRRRGHPYQTAQHEQSETDFGHAGQGG